MKKQNQKNEIVELYKPYVPEAVTSRVLEGKDSLPSERREVTVVFVDITGFTRLADRMDPEDAENIIKKIFKPIVDIVYKYGGSINKFLGDGILILFGASSSHEDDPERAVRASAEIQESLKRNGTIKVGKRERKLKMRIGINTGLCIAGEIGSPLRKEFTVIGDTVNLASRLQAASKPGKILISNNTFQRVKDIFLFSSSRKIEVKGKRNLVTVYYLKGEKKSLDFLEEKKKKYSPFVGRKRELKILEDSLKDAYKSKGQIIEINGELGVGKSRLILELYKSSFAKKYDILAANCTSWDELKPYAPLKMILLKIFEITDNDDFNKIEKKIKDKIKEIDSSLLFASAYFLKLFTSEIESTEEIVAQSKEEHDLFIRMIKKLLLSLSFKKPLLLIVEDMQWIDEASAELFIEFSKDIKEYSILMIYTFRESLKKIKNISGSKKIKLLPLSNSKSDELIKLLIEGNNIYKLMKDRIISATKGNPLFIEEVIKEIKIKKLSAEKDEGELVNYRGIFAEFQIPDTVQSIARARIDLLPMGLKETLYQASVFGQIFGADTLQKITNLNSENFHKNLNNLKEKEFIIEVKKDIESENNFAFSHSLIQEVAYNSLLFKDRKNLHNKIGLVMEKKYSSNIIGKIEELAYHFRNSNDKEKAVFYLGKAGDKAQSIYAFKSAINYLKDCIKYLNTIKVDNKKFSQFANIYNKIAFSQSIIGERKDAENNFKKALKYSKKLESKDIESLVLMNIGNFYGDMGQWDKSIKNFQDSINICNKDDLKRKAGLIKNIGLANIFKGDTEEGYKYLKDSLKICKKIKDEVLHAMVLNNIGIYYDMVGEWEKSINYYKKSLSIYKNHKNIIQTSNTMGNLGFAYSSLDQSEKAILYFNESIKLSEKTGDIYNKGINSVHLGEEYLKRDSFDRTKYYIEKAEEIFKKLNDKLGLADVFKVRAILSKKQKKWEDSDSFFKKAIDIYSRQRDRLNEGESYYEWADMCILRNDMALAKKRLIKSQKVLKGIGTKRYLNEIEKKLSEIKEY